LDTEGLDLDLVVHHFKKGFMPMVDSWDEVLTSGIPVRPGRPQVDRANEKALFIALASGKGTLS
jgi:hypothetical protein